MAVLHFMFSHGSPGHQWVFVSEYVCKVASLLLVTKQTSMHLYMAHTFLDSVVHHSLPC